MIYQYDLLVYNIFSIYLSNELASYLYVCMYLILKYISHGK